MSNRSPPSSIATSAEGDELLHMSRQSDAASRLGRLNLGSSNGSSSSGGAAGAADMVVTTRGQARQHEQRQYPPRASGRSDRRQTAPTAPQRAPPSTSRRNPTRTSTATRQPFRDPNSDDDEEDSSDGDPEDPDDSDPDEPGPSTNVSSLHSRTLIRAQLAAFDPWLSPPEFNTKPYGELHEDSRALRDLADQFARNIGSLASLQQQASTLPLANNVWGRRVADSLQQRVARCRQIYEAGTSAQSDTVWMLEELLEIYQAVNRTLLEPPYRGMLDAQRGRLIMLLCYILDYILYSETDVRRTQTAQHYAGGGGQYEYNLYMRFSTQQSRWLPFLDILDNLARTPAVQNLFMGEGAVNALNRAYIRQRGRLATGQLSQSGNELSRRVMLLFTTLGIPIPPSD